MLVIFAPKFPKRYRRRVARLLRKYADVYNLQNGWECTVTTEVASEHTASINCVVQSHLVQLDLLPERLSDLRLLETDIAHELWHVLYWRTASAIQHLPKKLSAPLMEAFEEDHDTASRVWLRHLFAKRDQGPEG
jgi:hypothetical protein